MITTHLGPLSQRKSRQFLTAVSIPQCLGAIDGTHIEIKQPLSNSSDDINQKLRFSMNIQAPCDCQHCSMDVVMKRAGSIHDARCLQTPN